MKHAHIEHSCKINGFDINNKGANMPGFLISNQTSSVKLINRYPDRCIYEEMRIASNGYFAARNTLDKYLEDKPFFESGILFSVMEGCILNKKKLMEEYSVQDSRDLISEMYFRLGETFFQSFEGCFGGALFDKKNNKWIVYTNRIGDNAIFYCYKDGKFVAGSQVNYIVDFCKANNIANTLNEGCIYQLLTYGFVPANDTYAKEIYRLQGGTYLTFAGDKIEIKVYHRFKKDPVKLRNCTETEIIELIDNTFLDAVRQEWEKDKEYGYNYLCDLSGGLDSRMNLWCSHELEEKHVTLLTYCKGGYLDETISREIAYYWKDELIFKPLDDASFMYDIEENTFMLGGLSFYCAITGGKRLLDSLYLKNYGIEHTGQVGDAVLGSFYHSNEDMTVNKPTGMYSEKLIHKLPEYVKNLDKDYLDYEIYLIYARAFRGACNSHLLRRNYTEVMSPFLNTDFLQLCLNVPVELRINHGIYKKWIMTKYPDAAQFKWEKIKGRISDGKLKSCIRTYGERGQRKILKILSLEKKDIGMNPIDYWISKDKKLARFLDEYKQQGMVMARKYLSEELYRDMDFLYNNGNAYEKAMVLTILASIRLYFD